MQTIPALLEALANLFRPEVFLVVLAATIVSLIVGVLPAISGGLCVIMLLPFLFGADPTLVMPILCALMAVSGLGGSITSVLTGIPGDNPNAATVLDGFAMTRKGEAGRSLGLALGTGVLSGVAGVLLSIPVIPLMAPILMACKTPEMLLIIVLALLFLAVLTKGSRVKGLISAGIGLTMACVGSQAASGVERLTFGNLYLYDGIETATVLMGILAVPTLLELRAAGVSIAPPGSVAAGKLSEVWRGAKEVLLKHKLVWLRGTLLGYLVGIAPALGSNTGVWIAYAQAKQASKNPDEMGKGSPEGIVAPESARGVCISADLLTTLVFGIPGSSIMVVFLAAFFMTGIQPGPMLVIQHTALAFEMLLSMALATLIAAVICFFGAPLLVKITRVSPHYLFAFLLPLMVLGAYVTREYPMDIIAIGLTALLGLAIKRLGFSAPSIILGFVLGDLFERYMVRSVNLYGLGFFMSSPISIVLTALIIISVLWGPAKALFVRLRGSKAALEGGA
ncbi:MAG TPA: tripartite tricarboxylate transporter permease [Anaerolineae bacterium]|nr:tripartite tricarboxylate transporter permease [Anaerolineae bacterium]